MPQTQVRRPKAVPREGTKTDWILIEGSGRTVLKTIAGLLKKTGDDSFEVEFRIFRSSKTDKGSSQPARPEKRKRRRGLGSLTTIFVPRRKRKK